METKPVPAPPSKAKVGPIHFEGQILYHWGQQPLAKPHRPVVRRAVIKPVLSQTTAESYIVSLVVWSKSSLPNPKTDEWLLK